MKWFQHVTCASRDEVISYIRAEMGAEGYALYFLILELIAEQMKDDNTYLTLSFSDWCNRIGITKDKLRQFIGLIKQAQEDLSKNNPLLDCVERGKLLTINAPKLIIYRDEWSKKKTKLNEPIIPSQPIKSNAGVTPELLRSNSGGDSGVTPPTEQNRTEQNRTEHNTLIDFPIDDVPKKNSHPKISKQNQVEEIYKLYPRKQGYRKAIEKIEIALRTVPFEELAQAVAEYAKSEFVKTAPRGVVPHPATWFFQQRWKDDRSDWHQPYQSRDGPYRGQPVSPIAQAMATVEAAKDTY